MDRVDAVATTAIGYSRRKKGDSLKAVDDVGNRNLVDAPTVEQTLQAYVDRFMTTSATGTTPAKAG